MTLEAHKFQPDGSFVCQFDNKKKFKLFTIDSEISPLEAMVRLGVMPDNGVLINKLINCFGGRVREMLEEQWSEKKKVDDSLILDNIPKELELATNWRMVEILSQLKQLELSTRNIDQVIQNLLDSANKYYKNRIPASNPEYSGLVEALDQDDSEIIEFCKNRLESYKKKAQGNQFTDKDHEDFRRGLLRELVTKFEEQQARVSAAQRKMSTAFVTANGTNTRTTQNAYHAIQHHVYSAEECTEERLWLEINDKNAIDTNHYPSMRKDHALYAVSVIESQKEKIDLTAVNQCHQENLKKIQKQNIKTKTAIHSSRKEWAKKHGTWLQQFAAYAGLFRDSFFREAFTQAYCQVEITGPWKWWYDFQKGLGGVLVKTPTQEEAKIFFDGVYKSSGPEAAQQSARDFLFPENKAPVYQSTDLLTAIAFTTYYIGDYFQTQMAAKHPLVTTGAFAAPSALMGSVALAAVLPSLAPTLHSISHGLATVLTVNGKLISQKQFLAAVAKISQDWLWLTEAKSPSEVGLMTFLGLPKITYVAADAVASLASTDSQSTLGEMKRFYIPEDISGKLATDQVIELNKSCAKYLLMLSIAIGVGIIAPALPAPIGPFLTTLDHINLATLMHGAGLFTHPDLAAVAAASQSLAEMKTANLFLGKLFGVLHFLHEKCGVESELYHFLQEGVPQEINAEWLEKFNKCLTQFPEKIIQKVIENKDQFKNYSLERKVEAPAPALVKALISVGTVVANSMITPILGVIGVLPFISWLLQGKKFAADSQASVVSLYLCEKFLNLSKASFMLLTALLYAPKTFAIAGYGAVARVIIGSLYLSLGIPLQCLNFLGVVASRLWQGKEIGYFVGYHTLEAIKPVVLATEIVGTIISWVFSPLVVLAPVVSLLALPIAWFVDKCFIHSDHSALSLLREGMKLYYEVFKPRVIVDKINRRLDSQANECKQKAELSAGECAIPQKFAAMLAVIARVSIKGKNFAGLFAAFARTNGVRVVDHNLQKVHKQRIETGGLFGSKQKAVHNHNHLGAVPSPAW